ncbi:MAG: DNA polymerase/3'-5' exonuclease PolX [Myxococcales bacterium]|nr:DNA polymerase/3'-5' exonuclease PolX [Myxococcales bacterium]
MPGMENGEVAAIFSEMADLTHIVGGDEHRIRSFRRAARIIENLPEDLATGIRYGTFEKRAGIGPGTVRRVKQILREGTCDDLRELRRQLPPGLRDLLDVKGIGASTARRLWQHLKIRSIEELERALIRGDVAKLPRMGQKTAEKLMKALGDHKHRIGRIAYVDARRMGARVLAGMEALPEIQRITLAGSLRRGKATIGDLDVLVASDDPGRVAARFVTLPEVEEVLVRGEGRCSVRLLNRQQCDLRVLPPENWGAGLHYFTGSQLHNIAVRSRGLRVAGLKISDKGIFVRDTEIRVHPGGTEEDIFAAAKLPFIEPELRENTGEIEAGEQGRLPRLLVAGDLKGDLHMHTVASDGKGTAEDMARAAIALGHEYIAITDHTKTLEVANGLDEGRLLAQVRHLREVEERIGRLRIAAGTEVDILGDGSLDLDEQVLRGLDWVVASVHSHLDMNGEAMTTRLIAAMETGLVDCIGHPTARRLDRRGGAELDWERLFQAARRTGVAMEVNGNPYRMDLPDVACRRAKEMGVHLVVNTDAHAPGHLSRQEYGVITARRGWAEARDIANTRPFEHLAELRRERFRTRGLALGALPAPEPGAVEVVAHEPVADQHWPEEIDDLAAADAPDDDADLAGRLARAEVDDALRERLDDWLRNSGDGPLEDALRTLGENPMMVAFEILAKIS